MSVNDIVTPTTMEEVNGRTGSEAPSSSSSNFYATDSPHPQPNGHTHTEPAIDLIAQPDALDGTTDGAADDQEDNSSVDMDLSDSRSPSPAPPPNGDSPRVPTCENAALRQTPKRKLSEEVIGPNDTAQSVAEGAKRPKLSAESSEEVGGSAVTALDLPVAIWQQVFLYLSPANLARCIRVCRTLRSHLVETKAASTTNKADAKDFSKVRVFDSETIWAHSRKLLHPNMPRPLARLTELQMLQLIGNTQCQFCGRPPVPLHPTTPFNCGPGAEGVRVFWPFGVRSCGRCIEENTLKVRGLSLYDRSFAYYLQDIDVLTSKAASLRNGLPHCFLTPDLHFVPDIQRTQPGGIPSHLRVAKVYYAADVQHIVEEQNDAISFGAGAAEEWKKGLPARGKEAMADAARWEQWEGQMPPGTDLSQLLSEYDAPPSTSVGQAYSSAAVPNGMQPTMAMNGKQISCLYGYHSRSTIFFSTSSKHASELSMRSERTQFCSRTTLRSGNNSLTSHTGPYPFAQQMPYSYPTPFTQPPFHTSSVYTPQNNGPFPPYMSQPGHSLPNKPAKATRTAQDVEEAFRARRADIERRCRELIPPLDPGALPHMPCFVATMQIAQPLTDEFWEGTLKPKVLAERDVAETAERTRQDQMVWLQAAVPHSAQDEPFSRPAKEVYDKEFEEAQEPLRRKLSEYADDFVSNHWTGGQLDKTNSPVFAVKVIEFVDRRYREDTVTGRIPQPEQPRGNKQGTPVPDPFLSLHNMKWVYDNKIRPRTDVHGRELFLCSGCTDSKSPKWLAFEGLIQHYGAKHTTAFSKGNVVVHWQTAEWPSELPFVRDPTYYVKHDKKSAQIKDHGRARRTPQTNGNPFHAPGSGRLLSESPFFSGQHQSPAASGYYQPSPDYQGYPYGSVGPSETPYSWPQQPALQNDQHAESGYENQLAVLANDISATWESLDGVKEDVLLPCIRLHASLHKAAANFESKYGRLPNLDQITDILATKVELRPVKEAQALACGLCVSAQTDGSTNETYYRRIQNVKLHNTSSLVSHFKLMHPTKNHRQLTDWTVDMIELPEPEMISRLVRAPGMDDEKLAIIAAAFPTALPNPLPKIGYVTEEQPENLLAQKLLNRHFKKKGEPPKKKKKGQHTNGTPAREDSEPLPEAREDEYDPRRPMALPTTAISPSNTGPFNFAPETLAALNQLNAVNAQGQQPAVDDRAERSPSVGHAEPGKQSMPDISQILAQLTGQPLQSQHPPAGSQQIATSDTTSRTSSQPKQVYQEPYGPSQGVSPHRYAEERPTSARYSQPVYRPSAEPSQRFESAQAYNARQFEHNRGQPYADPAYPPQPRSPPRYKPVYDEAPQYGQPPPAQYARTYRPDPPAQYVQVQTDRERHPPTYQYAQHSPPQPKYVDEHGRELRLVPVDSAPAPVQYVPHPMEQPHQQYAQRAAPPAGVYAGSPLAPQYPPYAYDDRRPVYYEAPGPGAPPSEQHYGYDNVMRGSVPRR